MLINKSDKDNIYIFQKKNVTQQSKFGVTKSCGVKNFSLGHYFLF
jgi:hypothetical protein